MADSYNGVPVPRDGGRIAYKDGRIRVPDNPIIPFIEGDGTGRHLESVGARIRRCRTKGLQRKAPRGLV